MSIGFSSLISIGMLTGWFGRTGELNSKYRYPVMTSDNMNSQKTSHFREKIFWANFILSISFPELGTRSTITWIKWLKALTLNPTMSVHQSHISAIPLKGGAYDC